MVHLVLIPSGGMHHSIAGFDHDLRTHRNTLYIVGSISGEGGEIVEVFVNANTDDEVEFTELFAHKIFGNDCIGFERL